MIVDHPIAEWLNGKSMCVVKRKYVTVRTPTARQEYLHRIVAECGDGFVVDHKNGNTFDNRKENLRVCTNAENIRHRVMLNKNNTSGKCGVHFISKIGKWGAEIKLDRKKIRLGQFKDLDAAIAARKIAEQKLFGEFAGNV